MHHQQHESPFQASPATARQIARWLGAVYVLGALTAYAWVAVPHTHQAGDGLVRSMATISLLGGAMMIGGYADRIRPSMVHLVLAGVQLIITISYIAIADPGNDVRLFYIWATPVAAIFFRPLAAAAHAAVASVVLAFGLWVHGASFGQGARIWLMTVGTLVAVNALIVWSVSGVRRRGVATSFAAHHDPLTGIPNRTLFASRTENALAARLRSGGQVLMLLIDLDRFKLVNDTHGHLAGDELLCQLAPRLVEFAPPGSTVARLGGDEFAVLVEDHGHDMDVRAVAERITRAWATPLELSRGLVHTNASVGVAAAVDSDDPTSLLRHADAAMYRAKARGRGCICVYDADQRADLERRHELERGLFSAVSAGQLSVMYQPIVDIVTGTVTSAEALLRWTHPQLGIVSPGEFIPIAEQSGLIDEIGLWVMNETLGQLATWRARGVVDSAFTVEVNVSAAQLHGDFAERIAESLDRHGIEPSALMLELTESVLMRAGAEGTDVLGAIDDLGVPLALDDFGTGFSSLAYLYQAKVHTVKIDQSFIGGMSSDATRRAIVDAVISLTRALGLRVVAEGVDTHEQIGLLVGMGCNHAQGFLIARPMRPAAIEAYLIAAAHQGVDDR